MRRQIILLSIFFSCLILCKDLIAQTKQVTVTGTVTDAATKETLVGVSVLAGSPAKALAGTDVNGKFSVLVEDGALLTFTYIGYGQVQVKLNPGQTTVNVSLKEAKNEMTEVVVRGYQKRTREVTTGSSYIVSGKELQDAPVANVEELLQGKVAGLNVQNNTGAPGMRGSVQVRGLSTLSISGTGNEQFLQPTSPLYVIDGVPMDADKASEYGFEQQGPGVSPLSLIPQEDIASIEILKDATATSLYGSRGAYGVIVIQTVRGNSKIPRVRYNVNLFMRAIPKLRETLGGMYERNLKTGQIDQYAIDFDRYRISTTPFLSDSLNAYYNNSTNWQGVFYRNTYNQSHNLQIDGGDARFNYKTNLGFYDDQGVIKNTGFTRYNLNMNMEFKPSDRLRFFGSMFGNLGRIKRADGSGLLQTGVAENGMQSTLLPGPSFYQASSAVISSLRTNSQAGPKEIRATVEGSYELLPGLTAAAHGSYNYTLDSDDTFTPAAANSQFAKIYSYYGFTSNLYNRNNISYNKSINEKHNFFVNLFSEIYVRAGKSSITQLERSPNDQFQGPLGYDGWFSTGGGVLTSFLDQTTASLAAAFTYDFEKKYIFDFTYRVDGTSNSGDLDPYAKNPSVGFRWNFQRENWLKGFEWLNYGALRLTAGKNIYPVGSLVDIYGQFNSNGNYNNFPRIGIDYGQIPNPYLKPKTVTQYNLGFDLGIFDGKLDIIYDTYYKAVDNELFNNFLSNTLAFNLYRSNDAGIANYGHELSLTTRPLSKNSPVQWTFMINGAYNTDILTKLPAEYNGQYIRSENVDGVSQMIVQRVGRNALSNYLLQNQGVYASTGDVPVDPVTGLRQRNSSWITSASYRTSFQEGDPIFYDANGDYLIDIRDYMVSGNSQPRFTGGISNTISYKKFSLNIYASYTAKRSILNNALAERLRLAGNPFGIDAMVPMEDLSMWRQTGDVATYANAYNYSHNLYMQPFRNDQTLWQADGSYLKINQITLSYSFDKKVAKRIGLNNIRTFLSTSNVHTFTKYSGPNPENVTSLGRDISGGYPLPRTYNFGFNVEF